MITCHRRHLLSRCRARGYTLDAVMPCVVSQDGDQWTIDDTHPAYPRARPGLGDRVASTLSAVGITKERVAAVIGDCGCEQRQQWLNEVGHRIGIGTQNPHETGNTPPPPPG